jgi:rod shape-determining protein MreC
MKFLKSKVFIICAIAVALLIIVTALLSAVGFGGPVRSVLKTTARPFEWMGSRAADALNGFVSVFRDHERLVEENEALKEQIRALENEKYDTELLQKENAWLKEYLNVASKHPNFELADARVISRESGNYSTILTLDRGKIHGVKKNMPVITEDGVFGYVKETGLDWCKVVSIVETGSAVGAYTDRTGAQGIVQGDIHLRAEGTCVMQYTKDADIRIGDRVLTAGGAESIYPTGLLIGEIVSIKAEEAGLMVEIQPSVDFTDIDALSRMMVICGYKGAE